MSETFGRVIELIERGEVRISEHGYDELAQDGILAREVMAGVKEAVVVEDYPLYPKGACVLVLQRDAAGHPIHVLWGIPKGRTSPAVVITAYRPDPGRWSENFRHRRV